MRDFFARERFLLIIWTIIGALFAPCASNAGDKKLPEIVTHAQSGDVERLKYLLDGGADPNTIRTGDRASLLIVSSTGGHIDVVRTLIAKGADPNLANGNGWTPLMAAVARGHLAVVRLLLENGADPNKRHAYGWTALKLAIQKRDKAMQKLLKEYGAKK